MKFFYKVTIFFFVLVMSVGTLEGATRVQAFDCDGDCSGSCVPIPGKPGFCRRDGDCNLSLSNGESFCSNGQRAVCGCGNKGCGAWRGATCTNSTKVCSCDCEPVSCPPGTPQSKFMTRGQSNGYGTSCDGPDNCDGNQYACPQKFSNAAPTCSMVPAAITMNRSDAPRQFTLTTTDADWGDTVKITGVEVVDTAGNLKSCVDIKTLTGNSIGNLVVRPGTDNSSALSATTQLLADASTAYGVYNDNGVCSGIVRLQIRDLDSDGNGPDTSDTVTCSMNVTVTNNLPQISAVDVRDRDFLPSLRRSGNLATQYRANDGNGSLPVGSLWDTRRVSRCTAPVDLSNNYGECSAWEPKMTRTNPYAVSFTVSDVQGIKDIKDVGMWIQRSDAAASPSIPLVQNASRRSIQALVGQRDNYQIGSPYYFTAAPCLGSNCTENITAQDLLGYSLITERGAFSQNNGNVSRSNKKSSAYKEWLMKGFPNCLFRGTGVCTGDNIPNGSTVDASADANVWENYDWTISADKDHMMCLSATSNTTSVIAKPSNGTCPSTCAACVALNSIAPNTATPNAAIDVSFLVWMNDRYINGGSTGAGMDEGRYEIFVGARDAVAGNAYNANFWGTIGGNNNRFSLVFDAEPPTVANFALTLGSTTTINGTGSLQDTRTGVSGWGNRFMIMEDLTDIYKPKEFLTDSSSTPWNGTDWPLTAGLSGGNSSKTFGYTGQGFSPATPVGVMGGFCAYDNAGNMCCVQSVYSGSNTVAKKECANYSTLGLLEVGVPWVQTTLGSVYSNTQAQSNAFQMSVSTQARSIVDPASLDRIPAAIDQNRGITLGGLFVTGGQFGGITGAANNSPLGYNRDAREETTADIRNIFGINDGEQRDWYSILYALVRKNCSLSGDCYDPSGKSLASIEAEGTGYFEVTDATSLSPLSCNGRHVVFIKGKVTLGEIKKTNDQDGCLFVVAKGASLKIEDPDQKDLTTFDRFDAAVVVADGGSFETAKKSSFTYASDRLQFFGFLYSDNTTKAPSFLRELYRDVQSNQNFFYSAEWFVFDPNLLGNLRGLLGSHRTVDIVCGTSDHILCSPN